MTRGQPAFRWVLLCLFAFAAAAPGDEGKAKPADKSEAVIEALQEVQDIVGRWEGLGAKSDKSKNWEESIDVAWKFNKNGKVSLYLTFADQKDKDKGRLLDDAMLTYDTEKSIYRLRARKAGTEDLVEFEGKRSKTGLQLDRVAKGKAKDELDRLDLKILNDGDRVVYTFQKRIGQSKRYQAFAQVGLNRQGTSIASKDGNGPKCIVTGGAGTMTISYEGATYYVCCSGCREMFMADPKKFIAKAAKK